MREPKLGRDRRLRLLLLLPLLLLAMPMAMSAQPATQPLSPLEQAISEKYSIDPQAMYSGSSVIKAIAVILEAADQAKNEYGTRMFDAGYKQGVLDWKPLADGLEVENEVLRIRYQELYSSRKWVVAGGLTLSALSFIVGLGVGLK